MERENKCIVEGCKRPYKAKGYCNVHYKKWRRGEMDAKPRYKTCSEENCKKPLYKMGLCQQHYDAWIASKKNTTVQAEKPAVPAEKPAAPTAEQPKA